VEHPSPLDLGESVPSFLFWNTNRKPVEQAIVRLARKHNPDLLILAEYPVEREELLAKLNEGERAKYTLPGGFSERLSFFVRLPPDRFVSVTDKPGIAIRRFVPSVGGELLIVAVHLPSKFHATGDDQKYLAVDLQRAIGEAEGRVGHRRTVVVGDFNMDPFEPGLVASHGLHAVMDRRIANRGSRTVNGTECPFFYNPMWSLMGDVDGRSPGTFYYPKSGPVAYFWHMFDQVLIRPTLLERFDQRSLCIMSSDGERSLAGSDGRPDGKRASDHFPIGFRLRD